MSFADDARELTRSLLTTSALLRQLLAAMQTRRTGWASARPSTLQPAPELERLAQELAATEVARQPLLDRMVGALPKQPGTAAGELHANVTRIAAALAPAVGRPLRAAADEATALARQVRTEVALGQRLLQFTQRAQEQLLARLTGQPAPTPTATGYDRHARAQRGFAGATAAGTLIDGRL